MLSSESLRNELAERTEMGVTLGTDKDVIPFQEFHENLGHIIMEHISTCYTIS